MSKKNLKSIMPNSLEFAKLSIHEQEFILERRSHEQGRGIILYLSPPAEALERPRPWYYETNGKLAIERWLDNQTLIRCTETIPFSKLTLRGEKRCCSFKVVGK